MPVVMIDKISKFLHLTNFSSHSNQFEHGYTILIPMEIAVLHPGAYRVFLVLRVSKYIQQLADPNSE
jgi:hypothetical protein